MIILIKILVILMIMITKMTEKPTGCLKKTEFSGYAGRDGCDGQMEGGRGLKNNYI